MPPRLQLASPHHLGNPARIVARLSLTASPSHCYYRRGYSTGGPTPSPSTNSSAPKDTLASPNNGPSLRKKVDLHPAPRKPTAAEVSTTPPKPPPPAPSASSNQSVASTEKQNIADANPETEQASAIRFAIEDMQKATQHGILAPAPENAGTVRRLLHQGIQLFKFYIRGIKLIGVHGKTVRAIRKRLATEQAEGKESRMTRWENQFIKTYNQDVKKLVPFLLIVLIIEEIIPLIVMYAPGILPSTCILPSQLERIHTKAENTRKEGLKAVSLLLKDVKVEDLKSLVAGGLKSFDSTMLKELCRVFGQASWGPGMLARRRLERHLGYLKTDDALLAAEGKGIRLSVPELRIALWDRGFVVDGVAESALRSKLANWVDSANNKEDADRLQMVLKCAKK
ncbi:hypothetical protein FS837_008447 [Tulasnella sp. UAMH 9824]|nr:hypothetical protein FS837_008447 [Tulasnella sp. UAMH 9824]